MKKIIILSITLISVVGLYAWPGGPGFNDDAGTNNAHTGASGTENLDTPVDGGIFTMTALAIGYGVRQSRKRKEEKDKEDSVL